MEWIRKRAEDRHYVLSEHIVRRIMGKKVSVPKIEAALQQGEIIEIHRNPSRAVAFLVLGFHDSQPLHVMCAPGMDGLLLLLFAYERVLKRPVSGENSISEPTVFTCKT